MNQTDEFVIDGSVSTELPFDRNKAHWRREFTPLAKALAAVAVVGLGVVLAYRAGNKRGKGD